MASTSGQKTISATWPNGVTAGIKGTLERDTSGAFGSPTPQTVTFPTLVVVQTGLSIGTTYHWRFKVDTGGGKFESAWSSAINGTPEEVSA